MGSIIPRPNPLDLERANVLISNIMERNNARFLVPEEEAETNTVAVDMIEEIAKKNAEIRWLRKTIHTLFVNM